MFRGSELPRMMSMLVLLAVLGMLILRASDASMWGWFVAHRSTPAPAVTLNTTAATTVAVEHPADGASQRDSAEPPTTDEDPEQQAEAAREFQAVLDGSLAIQPEENFAYARLFHWVKQQSWDELCRRAASDVVLADLMHSPQKYRGRLIRLDLNVRRVLAYDEDNSLMDVKHFYEIWGFTDESKAWPYDVVTCELPPGMPAGPDVYERAQFVGYFFKLQGYYEAGAKPRATPLRAPLLVGRLMRYPSAKELQARSHGWWELGFAAGIGVLILSLALLQAAFLKRAARRRVASAQRTSETTHQWLREEFPATEPPPDEQPCPAADEDFSRSGPS